MKKSIFVFVALVVVVSLITSTAQAAVYVVVDRDSLIDVLSRHEITLQPRTNGTIWEGFTLPKSCDVTIKVAKGSDIVLNCEYSTDEHGMTHFNICSPHRIDVEEVGPGSQVLFTDRALLENRNGSILTPELIRSLDAFDAPDEEEAFYFRYAEGTEFHFEFCHPFNLGEGNYDVIDIWKPTNEEITEQIINYQNALDKKLAQERPVGIRSAQPTGADDELESDEEEIELPEIWQPTFYRRGSWILPTDKTWAERASYIVRILDRENTNYIMVDDQHDPIYDQLLAPEYGPNAHFILSTTVSHWLEYTTVRDYDRRDKPDDDAITLRTARMEIPQDLILIEETCKRGGWQQPQNIQRHHTYWVIARDLLVNGLVMGSGGLEDKIALMAIDIGHGTHVTKQEKIGLLNDYLPRQTITFYCWADELTVPTSAVAGLKVDVATGNGFVIDGEPFRNEVDLREHAGNLTLSTTNGKPIGQLTLWVKTDHEVMESLERLNRDLTPEENAWLDRYLKTLN